MKLLLSIIVASLCSATSVAVAADETRMVSESITIDDSGILTEAKGATIEVSEHAVLRAKMATFRETGTPMTVVDVEDAEFEIGDTVIATDEGTFYPKLRMLTSTRLEFHTAESMNEYTCEDGVLMENGDPVPESNGVTYCANNSHGSVSFGCFGDSNYLWSIQSDEGCDFTR